MSKPQLGLSRSCKTLDRGISYIEKQLMASKVENPDIDEEIRAAQEKKAKLEALLARVAEEEAVLQHAKEECDAALAGAAPVFEGSGGHLWEDCSDESPEESFQKPQKEGVVEGTLPPVSPEKTATPSSTLLETPTSQATTVRALTSEFEKAALVTSPVFPRQRELRDGLGNGEIPLSSETLSCSPTVCPESQDDGVCRQDGYYFPDEVFQAVEQSIPETEMAPSVTTTGDNAVEFEDDFAGLAEALLISVGGSRVKVEKKDPPGKPKPTDSPTSTVSSDAGSSKGKEGKHVRKDKLKQEAPARTKHLSKDAATQVLRRLCKVNKRTGKAKVSPDVAKQFFTGGEGRNQLIKLLIACNGNKEEFKVKAEYSIKRSRGKKVKVQAGWYSEEAMRSDLKLSQQRIKAMVAFCSHKTRKASHTRRDKYQSNVKEYYIETSTGVDYEEGWDESMSQTFTAEPDTIHGVMLGVDGPGPSMGLSDGEGMGEAEDKNDGSQSGDEGSGSDDESDVDESRMVDEGRRAKRKHAEKPKEEPDDEDIAVVDETLMQILKMDAKLSAIADKLQGLEDSSVATEYGNKIRDFRSKLMQCHDDIACIKAEFDADQQLSKEKSKELKQKYREVELLCSRATMETTKIQRTVLKKAKTAKAPEQSNPPKPTKTKKPKEPKEKAKKAKK